MFSYSILNAQFSSLGSNFENWEILHDDKTWVGWKNDGNIDWCRTKAIMDAPIIQVQELIENKISNVSYKKGICPIAEDLHFQSYLGFSIDLYDLKLNF